MNVLYTIIIYPLTQVIEICYLFAYRVFGRNPAFAVCGVSITVSVLTLPLYFIAENWQQIERNTQKRLKPKTDKIKAVFRGDEQYLILSAYYRQNHYHPTYALRSSLGLLIQLPFFVAAFSYLSHLDALHGAHFLGIANLGAPDALIHAGVYINLLPILMTLINIIAGAVYTRNFPIKEKIQLYGMALVFLVLLYNSPAGLVLYWTVNNVFSLAKNILQKTKHPRRLQKIAYWLSCIAILLFDIHLLFFRNGMFFKRIFIVTALSSVFLLPFITKTFARCKSRLQSVISLPETAAWKTNTFIFSAVILFILTGLVIPASLIASSVSEFSFIETNTSPFPFIARTLLQSTGFFLFWTPVLYFLFHRKTKATFTCILTILCAVAVVNTFGVNEDFGFLTVNLIFSDPKPFILNIGQAIWNIALILLTITVLVLLLFSSKKQFLNILQLIVLISLSTLGIVSLFKINSEFIHIAEQKRTNLSGDADFEPIYRFSRTGKNVLFMMLDRGMPGFIPAIFKEKSELTEFFTGFTWYPNAVSFAGHTLMGAPPLYGGYEYTPEAINKNDTVTLFEKHRQAHLLLPRLFSESDYRTIVSDPQFDNYQTTNLSIFSDYPAIHAENIIGKYTAHWLQSHPNVTGLSITAVLDNNLIRFSFFKTVPFILRNFVYDRGEWLVTTNLTNANKIQGALTLSLLNNYTHVSYLPELTRVDDTAGDTYIELYSSLTHDSGFLQAPDYVPVSQVTDKGTGPFAENDSYHVNIAAYLLLAKWFAFLKEQGVYDNTRIVIVSDHGGGRGADYSRNIPLPDGTSLQAYHILLLVKDFNAQGTDFQIDDSFMTNADAPLLVTANIGITQVNPFTGKPLATDKANGVTIATSGVKNSTQHGKYGYRVGKDEWLHVHDNIFDPANWERAQK